MSIQTCLKKSHTIWQHRAVAVIWQQCTDTQVALVCIPIATHDLSIVPDRHAERSLSALWSWGISILDMSGYFYISLAFHLFTLLWKYGDLVVLVIRILVNYVWWRTFWKHLLLSAVSDKAIFFLPETNASSFTDMDHHHSAIVWAANM